MEGRYRITTWDQDTTPGGKWAAHYFNCDSCQVHDHDPTQDVFCSDGSWLRGVMIYEGRKYQLKRAGLS
jgi:hypothetical protein